SNGENDLEYCLENVADLDVDLAISGQYSLVQEYVLFVYEN
ncbi:hypothetical protein AAUPMB_16757, partial [Pasteurella multocida subsp. multocida str. Anand1_buffalo]